MQLSELTWPDIQSLPRETPIVFPIAALEQHGHHMPLFTDSLLLEEVIRRISDPLEDDILFAPLQWLGNSEHHLDFPGTLSAGPRTYLDLLRDVAENFLYHGFDRIVFLNGHGGNIVPSAQATYELRQKYREWENLLFLSATYWEMGTPTLDSLVQTQMGHAGEWETSMMLALLPELVKDYQSCETIPFGNSFTPGNRAWVMKDRTDIGHIGSPEEASKEKGEHLFETFANGTVSFLQRVASWDGQTWEA